MLNNILKGIFIAVLFLGCGEDVKITYIGAFFDSYTVGLKYKCGEYQGITGNKGSFVFSNQDECIFSFGENDFKADSKALSDGIVTPFEITNSIEEARLLAKIILSFSKEKGNELFLDRKKLDTLAKLDLKSADDVEEKIKHAQGIKTSLLRTREHLGLCFDDGGNLLHKCPVKFPAESYNTKKPLPLPKICLPGMSANICREAKRKKDIVVASCLPGQNCHR